MVEAILCPRCGAPLQVNTSSCPYCRVGLSGTGSAPVSAEAPKPATENRTAASASRIAPIPPGWVLHHDPWHGFTLSHPPGWEVVCLRSQVEVREDPAGLTSAAISPFPLPAPSNAHQVAQQFVRLARSLVPDFQAWQQGNTSPDSNRITLKTRATRFGQVVDGVYNILVEGSNGIISGYQAPSQAMAGRSEVLGQILATFRTAAQMERQRIIEPAEHAFSVPVPAGWNTSARVNRNNIGGKGSIVFSTARDAQGLVAAHLPNYLWNFMDGMGGMGSWFVMPGSPPALPYMSAAQYCAQRLAPELAQKTRALRVERIVERPDWAELGQIEMLEAGYAPGSYQSSYAMFETTFEEAGVRLRQKARVCSMRMAGGVSIWSVFLDIFYRAPDVEFATWEPILAGILSDLQVSPQWKMSEQQLVNNYNANAQADIARRQRQISQTLSETSDIISSSYWNRQASDDRISEQRSNAMLGYQNMVAPSGEEYKLPTGFDRYWVDGLGNYYGGSLLSQPDLNWTPLEPTGI
jgi:hypothetical protein